MKKFTIIWIGELISIIGSGITALVLAFYLYGETGDVGIVPLLTLCGFLPALIMNPVGGILADYFDRRIMMVIGNLGAAVGTIFVILNFSNTTLIIAGVVFTSVFAGLLEPAYKATVSDLVPKEQYGQSSGMIQFANSAKFLFSPLIAGVLYSVISARLILILDVFSFVISIILTLFVLRRLEKQPKNKEQVTTVESIKFIWKSKGIVKLLLLMTILCLYMGYIQTLFVPLMMDIANTSVLGIVQFIIAMGALVSSIIMSSNKSTKNFHKILMVGMICTGLSYAFIGISINIILITIFGFMFFFFLSFINMSADVLTRSNLPNNIQGRAWSVIGVVSQFGFIIAYATAGYFVNSIAPLGKYFIEQYNINRSINVMSIDIIFIVAGILISVVGVIMVFDKDMRRLNQAVEA